VFVESSKIAEEKEVSSNQVQKQNDLNETEAKAPVTKGNIREAKPLTGVEFRVQCGAFRDKNSADTQLAAKYRITEIIQEEFTDGWYKYTVGSFRTYEEASNYKELFIARTKISTAFIVAYRDGRRLAKISEAFK
jgi:cell division protein FtsN